jgi:hypothetical protein
MDILSGVLLAIAVGVFATAVGFDRDRAFYPTLLAVIASYDVLFAAIARPLGPVAQEAVIMAVFIGLAVAGFRGRPWLVVAGLLAHGGLDLAHERLVANPGVPPWWPMFCMGFDVAAAAWLALELASADRPQIAGATPLSGGGWEAMRQMVAESLEARAPADAKTPDAGSGASDRISPAVRPRRRPRWP